MPARIHRCTTQIGPNFLAFPPPTKTPWKTTPIPCPGHVSTVTETKTLKWGGYFRLQIFAIKKYSRRHLEVGRRSQCRMAIKCNPALSCN